MSIYTEEGYTSRRDYLENLADDMGIDFIEVFTLAYTLGPSEDFDGLVTMCEDRAAELEDKARQHEGRWHTRSNGQPLDTEE
jgi:hypothetical protein